MFSRRQLSATLALAAILSASSLAGAPAFAADKLRVRLDWTPWASHAPIHLAVQKGLFAKHGLEVSVDDGNGSVTTVQIVGNGEYDIGHASHRADGDRALEGTAGQGHRRLRAQERYRPAGARGRRHQGSRRPQGQEARVHRGLARSAVHRSLPRRRQAHPQRRRAAQRRRRRQGRRPISPAARTARSRRCRSSCRLPPSSGRRAA